VATRKRKPGGGAAKGASFERHMAKHLSLWLSDGASPDLLWRTAGSGARSTTRARTTGKGISAQASDLASIDPRGEVFMSMFAIELKHYKRLTLERLVYDAVPSTADGTLGAFWVQALEAALSVKRHALLIVKENLRPPVAVVAQATFKLIAELGINVSAYVYSEALDVCLMPLDAFLRMMPLHAHKELCRCFAQHPLQSTRPSLSPTFTGPKRRPTSTAGSSSKKLQIVRRPMPHRR
jgi:hypothetical protein